MWYILLAEPYHCSDKVQNFGVFLIQNFQIRATQPEEPGFSVLKTKADSKFPTK